MPPFNSPIKIFCSKGLILQCKLSNWNYYLFKLFLRFWLAPIRRLILHNQPALTKFGRWERYTIDSMVYLIVNEVNRWYIWLKTRLLGQKTIDQPRFQARRPSCLFTSEQKKMVFTAIRNEIAEFLTKPEWKESTNTQNILLVGCYILFDAKKPLFISWNCAEK